MKGPPVALAAVHSLRVVAVYFAAVVSVVVVQIAGLAALSPDLVAAS